MQYSHHLIHFLDFISYHQFSLVGGFFEGVRENILHFEALCFIFLVIQIALKGFLEEFLVTLNVSLTKDPSRNPLNVI